MEKHIRYGTVRNSPNRDLDPVKAGRKNSQVSYNYQNNIVSFESIFHGKKLPPNTKITSIQLEQARKCCEVCKVMALGVQVLQDKKLKEEKKKIKSPISPSSVEQVHERKPQNPYVKEICDKQRKIYSSLYDVINRVVFDADQKRKKIITCEQFFLKLEENLKILGGILS